jgi:hypothetical protein
VRERDRHRVLHDVVGGMDREPARPAYSVQPRAHDAEQIFHCVRIAVLMAFDRRGHVLGDILSTTVDHHRSASAFACVHRS